jgi:flagellar motor component MotA
MLEKIANSLPDTESKIEDHEKRLRSLETRMGWAVGGFGLVAAVMPWIVNLIS